MAKYKKCTLPKELYPSMVEGYEVTYASISSSKHIQICLKEMIGPDGMGMKGLEDYPYRVVSYLPEMIDENNGFHMSTWWDIGYLYSVMHLKAGRSVALTDIFRVSERDTDIIDIGKPREEWDDFTRVGQAIRIIGGHVYAAGQMFKLYRRVDVGEWTDLTDPKEHPNLFKHVIHVKRYLHANTGFDAFDGFSEEDIYAGGEKALWRFDGQRWHELELPEYPTSINAVLCAGDGWARWPNIAWQRRPMGSIRHPRTGL